MATLKDIADKAGLSIPTVSRILNPKGGKVVHSPETVSEVSRIAKKLNYSPNAAARSLITNRTDNIAFILDSLRNTDEENVFWSPIINGIMQASSELGISCMLGVENYSDIDNFEIPKGIREKKVDGFIISHPLGVTDIRILEKFRDFGLPFVVVSMYSSDAQIWTICTDHNIAYYQACMRLAELGHKKIGYCTYPPWNTQGAQGHCELTPLVLPGYPDLDFVPVITETSTHTHKDEAFRIADEIAKGKLRITALICGDVIAMYVLERLESLGIKVPTDFSLISAVGTFITQFAKPKLSSFQSPLREMGMAAVSLLQEIIKMKRNKQSSSARHITLSTTFIERESTGPAPSSRS